MSQVVPNFAIACDILLDYEINESINPETLAPCTELLYGLIHARYILTPQGQEAVVYNNKCTK